MYTIELVGIRDRSLCCKKGDQNTVSVLQRLIVIAIGLFN